MCDEPTAPTEETHAAHYVNELTHIQPIACNEVSIYLDDTGEAVAWVRAYADALPKMQHHCLINQLMMKPPQIDDTLRFERVPHLSRQQIYEALDESDTIEINRITYIKDVHDHE